MLCSAFTESKEAFLRTTSRIFYTAVYCFRMCLFKRVQACLNVHEILMTDMMFSCQSCDFSYHHVPASLCTASQLIFLGIFRWNISLFLI
jgi:hypothetical protein